MIIQDFILWMHDSDSYIPSVYIVICIHLGLKGNLQIKLPFVRNFFLLFFLYLIFIRMSYAPLLIAFKATLFFFFVCSQPQFCPGFCPETLVNLVGKTDYGDSTVIPQWYHHDWYMNEFQWLTCDWMLGSENWEATLQWSEVFLA